MHTSGRKTVCPLPRGKFAAIWIDLYFCSHCNCVALPTVVQLSVCQESWKLLSLRSKGSLGKYLAVFAFLAWWTNTEKLGEDGAVSSADLPKLILNWRIWFV